MQREEFVQQLWLDYIHQHPEIGGLRLWPVQTSPDYLALLTVNHGPFGLDALLPSLAHLGFRPRYRHAMADRGLLVALLSPPDDSPWLVLGELQLGTLPRGPREQLQTLIAQTPKEDRRGQNLLSRCRPWPMPDWQTYRQLHRVHPLAGLLSVNGPRMHHAGFDCSRLGEDITDLDGHLRQTGLIGSADRHHGIFPVSPLVDYRFYQTRSQRLAFAEGDEHRIDLGGLALVQKEVHTHRERAVELLLPHHTRCEVS